MTPERFMLWKRCRCRGSSSGPRLIFGDQRVHGDTTEVTVLFALFACDRCDTPWADTPTHDGMPFLRGKKR